MTIIMKEVGGGRCPNCGEYGRLGRVEEYGDDLRAEYECRECGAVFYEIYSYECTEYEREA